MSRIARRPRLAQPFTVASHRGAVWLIAGEDTRYSLRPSDDCAWLAPLLERCDGSRTVDELIAEVPGEAHVAARDVIEQLSGERVLIEGGPGDSHRALAAAVEVVGEGDLAGEIRRALAPAGGEHAERGSDTGAVAAVLVQDRLEYAAALDFDRDCLERGRPWIWLTTGPMARAYVGPLLLPDAGPCLACLLWQFERLSPVPETYRALIAHARDGKPVAPVPFPEPGRVIALQVLRWKLGLAAERPAPASLYRLHVLEADTMELSQHLVFADPECPVCARYK